MLYVNSRNVKETSVKTVDCELLAKKLKNGIQKLLETFEGVRTPRVKMTKRCNQCSKNICYFH